MRNSFALSWAKIAAVALTAFPSCLALAPAAQALIQVQWATRDESAPQYRLTLPSNDCQHWKASSDSAPYISIGKGQIEILQGAEPESQHAVDVANDGNRLVVVVLPSPAKWVLTVEWEDMFDRNLSSASVSGQFTQGTMTYFVPNQQGKLEEKGNWPVDIGFGCRPND